MNGLYKFYNETNMGLMTTTLQIRSAMNALDNLQLIQDVFRPLGSGFISYKSGDKVATMKYGDDGDVIEFKIPGVDPAGLEVKLEHVHQHYYRVSLLQRDGSVLSAASVTIPQDVYDLDATDYTYAHGILYVNLRRLPQRPRPRTSWSVKPRQVA